MATAKERDDFIAVLVRALPDLAPHQVTNAARLLLRHAKTHGRIAEMECNGHPIQSQSPPQSYAPEAWNALVNKRQAAFDAWCEMRTQQLERRITEICQSIGVRPNFGGDPRGYTVKLHLPTGVYNTWGGAEEGYGVPQ